MKPEIEQFHAEISFIRKIELDEAIKTQALYKFDKRWNENISMEEEIIC